jgi:hypothetical protein
MQGQIGGEQMANRKVGSISQSVTIATEEREKHWGAAAGNHRFVIAGAVAAVLCLAIYLLRLDGAVGYVLDDAWYVLLGKALATGQGYTLINSPSPGILPIYPPVFPLALALVFKLAPNFPDNVWLLKSVSIAAMFGASLVCYRYFTHYRKTTPAIAALISLALLLNPALVFLATSTVMSECFFTLIQMLAILLVEKCVREGGSEGRVWRWAAAAGVMAGLAFLTRSISAGLVVAALAYLLRQRLLRQAAIFALAVGLLAGPWVIYSRLHAPTEAQQAEQNSFIVYPYAKQFWHKVGADSSQSAPPLSWQDLPTRVVENSWTMAGRSAGEVLAPALYRSARFSGLEVMGVVTKSLWLRALACGLSALILIGLVSLLRRRVTLAELYSIASLGIFALWPGDPTRFVLPLLPFLAFYLLGGQVACLLRPRTASAVKEGAGARVMIATACLLIVGYAYDHLSYIIAKNSSGASAPIWLNAHQANEAALRWMHENVRPEEGAIATSNPALVYLYTGSKTVGNGDPAVNWEMWKTLNVRYFAYVGWPVVFPARTVAETPFRAVYQSPRDPRRAQSYNLRVLDLGPAATRAGWNAAK